MPWKAVGTTTFGKKKGKWTVFAHHATVAKAKAQVRLLYMKQSKGLIKEK
jgi:hypothetical protein